MSNAPDKTVDAKVLIADDVPANLDLLYRALEPGGYTIMAAPNGRIALDLAQRAQPEVILLDVLMPEMDGYETCRQLKENAATKHIPVIFITAQHDISDIVKGFRAGGIDYITKPFQTEEVLARVETHLKISRLTQQLQKKNQELEAEVARREQAEDALQTADEQLSLISTREAERWGLAAFIGQSETFGKILADIRKVQQAGTISVLITGESGTGKELIARAIHYGGARAKGPFLPVNCTAIPKDIAESLFFGHARGAFSGANSDQKGYFELAHGGTLFLDEIGDMPAALQGKLLRALEEGFVTPLGATKPKQVNVRVVAASNVDFQKKIAGGDFRNDLYFRLARFTVAAPPLRDRPQDIPLLAAHFLQLFAREIGVKTPALDADALAALMNYSFPGNVRELKNIIERSVIESSGKNIRTAHLKLPTTAWSAPTVQASDKPLPTGRDLPLNLEQAELLLIHRALAQTEGNVSKAAVLLGVNRARIYRMLAQAEES
jgi:DNA-binding NtrC family response regulator